MDVKKSSYKKLSKLLTTFEKKVRALKHCVFHYLQGGVTVLYASFHRDTCMKTLSYLQSSPHACSAFCSASWQRARGPQGVLTQKVIHKQDNLSAVNASHTLLASFVERGGASGASVNGAAAADSAPAEARGGEARAAATGAASSGGAARKIVITTAYRRALHTKMLHCLLLQTFGRHDLISAGVPSACWHRQELQVLRWEPVVKERAVREGA